MGRKARLNIIQDPIRVDPREHPELQSVGGRLIVNPPGNAPMLIEVIGTRQYRVLSLVCPHRGSIVNRTDDGFLCPNHGARFTAEGHWVGGQSTVDLSPVAFSVESDGVLVVGGIVAPPSPPALAISQNTIAFSATVGGAAPTPQTVQITNTGGGTLTGISLAITYGASQPVVGSLRRCRTCPRLLRSRSRCHEARSAQARTRPPSSCRLRGSAMPNRSSPSRWW
jgi:nitrite reductase/ring-hydroxylating ferredoxin subunit